MSIELKRYDDLKETERCLYEAFHTVLPAVSPREMAELVNSRGFDVDRENAVLLLADEFGFRDSGCVDGKTFASIIGPRFQPGTKIVALIHENKALLKLAEHTASVEQLLRHPLLDKVKFHTISCNVEPDGIKWYDKQRHYPLGPGEDTVVIYFARFTQTAS